MLFESCKTRAVCTKLDCCFSFFNKVVSFHIFLVFFLIGQFAKNVDPNNSIVNYLLTNFFLVNMHIKGVCLLISISVKTGIKSLLKLFL